MNFIKIFRSIIESPVGSFSFVCGACWLAWWITQKLTIIHCEHEHLKSDYGRVREHVDEIRSDLSYIKGTIAVIKSSASDNPLTKSKSPISLTDKGIEVASEINAEQILAKNWSRILEVLTRSSAGKNAYDIQQYCMEAVFLDMAKFFDAASIVVIKNTAFKGGYALMSVTNVLAIMIRDRYLKTLGIDLSVVDANAPTDGVPPR